MESLPDALRATYHCGYMEKKQWTAIDLPKSFDGEVYNLDVCPGWVVRQPAVVEAATAYDAYEHGEFTNFYPNTPNSLVEAVQAMGRSLKTNEAFRMRQIHGNHNR